MFRKNVFKFLIVAVLLLGLAAFANRSSTNGYREYVVFVSQYGASDPTVVVLYDDLGSTMTWGRSSTGFYSVWSTVQLPVDKTIVLISGMRGFIRPVRDANEITLYTWSPANILADGVINNTWIVIRVYD